MAADALFDFSQGSSVIADLAGGGDAAAMSTLSFAERVLETGNLGWQRITSQPPDTRAALPVEATGKRSDPASCAGRDDSYEGRTTTRLNQPSHHCNFEHPSNPSSWPDFQTSIRTLNDSFDHDVQQSSKSLSRPRPPSADQRQLNDSVVQNHELIQHVSTAGKIRCNICGLPFALRKTFLRHLRSVHQHLQFKCVLCNAYFKRKDILDRHVKHQHETDRVECMICGKQISARALAGHWKSGACRAVQDQHDADLCRKLQETLEISPLDTSGKSGLEAVANLWVLVANLFSYLTHDEDGRPTLVALTHFHKIEVLKLYGFAIRTLAKTLSHCPWTARTEVAAALTVLDIFEYFQLISKGEEGVFRAILRSIAWNWFCFADDGEHSLDITLANKGGRVAQMSSTTLRLRYEYKNQRGYDAESNERERANLLERTTGERYPLQGLSRIYFKIEYVPSRAMKQILIETNK